MSNTEEDLRNLLRRCTVRIQSPGRQGTGFFVGQSLVLTCRHVLLSEHTNFRPEHVEIFWNEQRIEVQSVSIAPDSSPDLALLVLSEEGEHPVPSPHPCPWLFSTIRPGDRVFAYGYTEEFGKGGPASFEYEGEFEDEQKRWGIKLNKGRATFGLSGAPVLNLRTRNVFGVVYYSSDPASDLGAWVIPIAEATAQWGIIFQQQKEFHQHDSSWISFLPIYRLQKQESSVRERLFRGELFQRSSTIASPLLAIWKDFIQSEPWHEWVNQRCKQIKESANAIKEGRELLLLLDNIDIDEPYDNIVSALRPLCAKSDLIRRWLDRYRREKDTAWKEMEQAKSTGITSTNLYEHLKQTESAFLSAKRIWKQIVLLKNEIAVLRFSTCFLVAGSLGSGKTHFLATLLRESLPNPYCEWLFLSINPFSSKNQISEDALLKEVSRHTDIQWESLSDLNRYLASLNRSCTLVIALDGLCWNEINQSALKRLAQFIAESTVFHQLRWLIEIDLHDYPKLASQSHLWNEYGFRGRRSEKEVPEAVSHKNIGGWLTLDDLNRKQKLGIELIKTAIYGTADSTTLLESLPLAIPATLDHLVNPFIAWAFIEVRGFLPAKSLVSLNFIEFVAQFWKALMAKMASVTKHTDLFRPCAALVASYYFSTARAATVSDLLEFFSANSQQVPELKDSVVALEVLAELERANLLEIRKSDEMFATGEC